jgi:hypothetical protein
MTDAAECVWRHCWGYPGADSPVEFRRYFLASRLKTGIDHFGYGDAPVERVRDALEIRSAFMKFALVHQLAGKELQDAYVRESKTWPS